MNNRVLIGIVVMVLCVALSACSRGSKATSDQAQVTTKAFSAAVFVPGVVAGSPTYEMLVAGVRRAAAESPGTQVKVVEGGFNQGEWIDSVTALAATAAYDVIVTSNPALPEICAKVAARFPNQKFIVLDGYLAGSPGIFTFLYNQMEQSYLVGHMGGLVTTSSMPGANKELKAGLIAGQEYPIMNQVIRVGFEKGLKAVDPGISLDFRVVGNWYDATRGAELAASMFDQGVDVILVIAGGASQGVLAEAKSRGKYILWYDSNGYDQSPGTVVGSSALKQEQAAYEKTLQAIAGTLPYGTAEVRGVRDGYVEFIEDDPLYIQSVPLDVRQAQRAAVDALKSGRLQLTMPTF